jgi:opacity protein-like surface antigen
MMYYRWSFSLGAVLLVIAPFIAGAESPRESGALFRAGAKLGPGLVTWSGDDANSEAFTTAAKSGYSIAAFASVDVSRLVALDGKPLKLGVQPEISYAARGANFDIGVVQGSYDVRYLAVAVVPRLSYSAGWLAPYVLAGPELGFLLRGDIVDGAGNVTDISDDFTSTDLGLVLGLGADIPMASRGALVLELRATLSLRSIDGQGDGDDIKNQGVFFMLGYCY